jgi:hypothetical protein
MAVEKIIKIRISTKGTVEYEVSGIKGTSCANETKFLDEALGGEVSTESTTEYFEETTEEANKNDRR